MARSALSEESPTRMCAGPLVTDGAVSEVHGESSIGEVEVSRLGVWFRA